MSENIVDSGVLHLENRKVLTMTCVSEVEGFFPQCLKLVLSSNRVTILGENIKIVAFNKANGSLTAEGQFNEIKYMGEKKSVLKRIFK